MESLMADGDKNMLKDEDVDGDGEDYSNWDISYEESPPGAASSSGSSSVTSLSSSSHSTSTATKNNNNNNENRNKNVGTIKIPYTGSLRYQGPPLSRHQETQQALQHVDSHVSTLAASLFGNTNTNNEHTNISNSRSSTTHTKNNNINNSNNKSVKNINKKGTGTATAAASSFSSSSPSQSLRNVHPIQPDWQKVVGSKEKFYVYSAYYNTAFE